MKTKGSQLLDGWGCKFALPNIKNIFVPDPGYVIVDVDLEQADAQVVAWESGCQRLKDIFKDPTKDLHDENTKLIYGLSRDDVIAGRISESSFKNDYRFKTKGGVHGTNYRGGAPTIAKALGISVREAENFQALWFRENPEILKWHEDTERQIIERGYIENKFGFRRYFLERMSKDLLNEAQAWVPQSTVGSVINQGWMNIEERINGRKCNSWDFFRKQESRIFVKILMQVHDSLVMMIKKRDLKTLLPEVRECMLVTIPYDDPLIIGVGNPEISDSSYGEVKPHTWEGELIVKKKHG